MKRILSLIIGYSLIIGAFTPVFGVSWSDSQVADAIYWAEGGKKTSHAYGILPRYKHTTPRQACINTVKRRHGLYEKSKSTEDFVLYLSRTYAPAGALNDPRGLNRNWVKNVNYYLNNPKGL